ncbi:MAG: aminotransferase class V-fold PLP-dependent enzyme, partial [Sandaracinaceae bacterium]
RVDAESLARLAQAHGALSVFDGVCATAAERFEMERWGADVYLTASQKAIGLPAGLALMVASPRALAAREALEIAPPMSMDFAEWIPIMRAYEARRPSYFSTPATTLVRALPVGLDEILADGMEARFALHARAGRAFRAAWSAMGLTLVPASEDVTANTLSALWYPDGVDASLVGAIKAKYFRVGHMGAVLGQRDALHQTVRAVAEALTEKGHAADADPAIGAFDDVFG